MDSMRYWPLLLFLTHLGLVHGQDEKEFQQWFSPLSTKPQALAKGLSRTWVVESPEYVVDLDQDGKQEKLVFSKEDGIDRFKLFDHQGKQIYRFKFSSQGPGSWVYQLRLFRINPQYYGLLLSHYAGQIKASGFDAYSGLYLLSFQSGPTNFRMTRGRRILHEKDHPQNSYFFRRYKLMLEDFNGDQSVDVGLKSGDVFHVYLSDQKGGWKAF
jgi:hypothetical protein